MARIAVVEDNADNRLLVDALLGHIHEIVEFETGADAVAGLESSDPDLILLDISLPGMDGTEGLAGVRAHEALGETPVVALTAHAMAGDREKYLALGFDEYVTKPIVDEAVLFSAIDRCLNRTS